MVAMLNAAGGILVYGVRQNGVIYGERITRKEQDNLNLAIDNIVKRIIPTVGLEMYNVSFVPVDGVKDEQDLQVLMIRVQPGEAYQLYEDPQHEVTLHHWCDVAYKHCNKGLIWGDSPNQVSDVMQ